MAVRIMFTQESMNVVAKYITDAMTVARNGTDGDFTAEGISYHLYRDLVKLSDNYDGVK